MNALSAFARVLILTLLCHSMCQADQDNLSTWKSAVEQYLASECSGSKLFDQMVTQARQDEAFLAVVQRSLRCDSRAAVRAWAGCIIVMARGPASSEDCVYMLSDSDETVRGIANGAIKKFKMDELASCFPALLLRKSAAERVSAIKGITYLLGAKGLPYYVQLLDDSDTDVAVEAAKGFRVCRKQDASPHLLEYLKRRGTSRRNRVVVVTVINSLEQLYNERLGESADLRVQCKAWIARIQEEVR